MLSAGDTLSHLISPTIVYGKHYFTHLTDVITGG